MTISVCRVFLLGVLVFVSAGALANTVTAIRVIGDPQRTRLVVDLEKSPDYRVLRLPSPYRVVIDMPDVEFAEPAPRTEGRGLIADFRCDLVAPRRARIVLDLSGPAGIVNTFILNPVGAEPARLVIDMAPTTADDFARAAADDRSMQEAAMEPGARTAPKRTSEKPVVVIDPGHGGIDAGAMAADGLLEKDLTLKFAQELARQLQRNNDVEAVLTRTGDRFLSLSERVKFARHRHAALFVSIHVDKVRQRYVRGASVYTLSEDASDELAAATAARENRSDLLAGLDIDDQPDDVADILFDLARRETKNSSIHFAKILVDGMIGSLPMNSNPSRTASLKVLTAAEVPSVLLELGFISNKHDKARFRADDWPAKEAKAVAVSIEKFIDDRAEKVRAQRKPLANDRRRASRRSLGFTHQPFASAFS